ncbi:hypothetical protein O6P43_018996 [Quillaja saponaria]|uniref:Uncharacterized protein n=1 Tax=Quillaja saponaria TaxID=32244 RepID=A0AAD7LJL8_QUISA|nr:hypothetical protein O6P43_018996 [Quillaja saponaria]
MERLTDSDPVPTEIGAKTVLFMYVDRSLKTTKFFTPCSSVSFPKVSAIFELGLEILGRNPMHSEADVVAFQDALVRDMGGDVSNSQPSVSEVGMSMM